jgi:arginase
VTAARADGDVPVLLGGDCTLVLGAVRALRPAAVLYVDGDADLDVPAEGWGVLDSCGVAHLLGDGDPALALDLTGADVALFGFHPAQLSPGQWHRLARHRPVAVPAPDVAPGDGRRAAETALTALGPRNALIAHFDVDVVDYASFPLADCPRYHGGLALDDALGAIAATAARPELACLTIAEVNPDHDRSGALAGRLVRAWAAAVAAGLAARNA